MYAIVAQGGQQYRVAEGDVISVDRINAEPGNTIDLEVLMLGGDDLRIGTPTVEGAKVVAEVISHDLGAKRETFKYRPTRRMRRGVGFRPSLTSLRIQSISV